jgi:hypothetical protein
LRTVETRLAPWLSSAHICISWHFPVGMVFRCRICSAIIARQLEKSVTIKEEAGTKYLPHGGETRVLEVSRV